MVKQDASARVVQAVAAATDADPLELPPLQDAVDADALNVLIEHVSDGEVSFAYADTFVTVDSAGEVRVGDRVTAGGADRTAKRALD